MNDDRDPWAALTPTRPPVALREQVLAAARHASAGPSPGLLEALYRDRLLRACAAGLAVLVIANAIAAGGGTRVPAPALSTVTDDDAAVPGDTGLTASEQADELAPELGEAFARSRG